MGDFHAEKLTKIEDGTISCCPKIWHFSALYINPEVSEMDICDKKSIFLSNRKKFSYYSLFSSQSEKQECKKSALVRYKTPHAADKSKFHLNVSCQIIKQRRTQR